MVNGSRGIVKDIVYEEGKSAPDLPTIVWTEIDPCNGPSYFPEDDERKIWFPIIPVTHTWHSERKGLRSSSIDGIDWEENTRTMLPLRLSWALTIWKAQGQTIKSKIVLHLGKSEKEHGLTYTAFSRATKFSDVGIFDGFESTRFTHKIPQQTKMASRLAEERRYREKIKRTRDQYGQ